MTAADESVRRMVFCVKLQRDLPGLDAPPWPGPLGQRIYEQVSREAWEMWEERMKMILNEYRLLPFQKEAQAARRQAHGRVFLRQRRGAPARVRPTAVKDCLRRLHRGYSSGTRAPRPRHVSTDRSFFGHPRGLSTLFFSEMWERFSYYGMRGFLMLYMTAPLATGGMGLDTATAAAIYGTYTSMVYLMSLPGGWIADRLIGQRRAVLTAAS